MDIRIKASGIAHTAAIDAYIEKKIGALKKYLAHIRPPHSAYVEVGKTSARHEQGDVMTCHAHLSLPRKALHAHAEAVDLYAAIDRVRDELERQIVRYKERRREQ